MTTAVLKNKKEHKMEAEFYYLIEDDVVTSYDTKEEIIKILDDVVDLTTVVIIKGLAIEPKRIIKLV
jgi:hypothetical protein